MADAEKEWPRYLEPDDGSPEAFFGQVLTLFAARVVDQELESMKRRTREELERARQQGKGLGPPRKFRPNQVETMQRMRDGGVSLRQIAADFECLASPVLRVCSGGKLPHDHQWGQPSRRWPDVQLTGNLSRRLVDRPLG